LRDGLNRFGEDNWFACSEFEEFEEIKDYADLACSNVDLGI